MVSFVWCRSVSRVIHHDVTRLIDRPAPPIDDVSPQNRSTPASDTSGRTPLDTGRHHGPSTPLRQTWDDTLTGRHHDDTATACCRLRPRHQTPVDTRSHPAMTSPSSSSTPDTRRHRTPPRYDITVILLDTRRHPTLDDTRQETTPDATLR